MHLRRVASVLLGPWRLLTSSSAATCILAPSQVGSVNVPSMMLLGDSDMRVPPAQGRSWVAALERQPHAPPVVALQYPGEGHAIAGSEANPHVVQSVVTWLSAQLGVKADEA